MTDAHNNNDDDDNCYYSNKRDNCHKTDNIKTNCDNNNTNKI